MITIEEARQLYQAADPAHDFAHVLRVLRLAERIGAAEGADLEMLRAAALLHDVARAEERAGGPCHAHAGAERAREILRGADPARIDAVAEAIASHRFRSGPAPASLEARILSDADRLDAMGAIGIARAYATAGTLGQALWPEMSIRELASALEEGNNLAGEHTPVHEWLLKLSRLQATLYTATAQRIGRERHAFMEMFFRRLEQEVMGADGG
ncbi:MAG: HD domain-containing protein [Anaerolineae bacterium]|nr:HD domain-containing protein [Anaerolineae bacterium]